MTEICLKTYLDVRIEETKESLRMCQAIRATKFEGIESSIKEAARLMELRLKGMNEIRQQLSDQANTFLLKGEYTVQHQSLSDRVNDLVSIASTHVTRSELLAVAGLVSAAVSTGVMIVLHILGLK